jgi:hypothetical protein
VLHAFAKKTQSTQHGDIELARRRYKQISEWYMARKKITKSSGNVFVDLGFPPAEASILAIRSDLVTKRFLPA